MDNSSLNGALFNTVLCRNCFHFDPNYFAGGVKWQLPDLCQSEISYMIATQVYEVFDRKIVNATEGGCLEIFPRISLAEFVGRK
jgi:hypothetical protein